MDRRGDSYPPYLAVPLNLSTAIRNERFTFADLREVLGKANEEKSGDQLAGLAARTERERIAAKLVLADLTLEEIVNHPLIDPDTDEVSRLILEVARSRGICIHLSFDRRRVSRMDSRRYDDRSYANGHQPGPDARTGRRCRQANEQQRPGSGCEQGACYHPMSKHDGATRSTWHSHSA